MIQLESLEGQLLLVRLERPEKRNALTRSLITELTAELARIAEDASLRGVILAGAGASFCAGVDLHEFADATPESVSLLIEGLSDLCAAVREHPKPIACAIQGHCLGGALELAACCDLRVCAPDAQLGMPEVLLGIPSVIDAVMLGHLVGVGRARELLLTGDPISGQTAYEWGLANRLAGGAAVIDVAGQLLARITRHDSVVIAAQKRLHQEWLELAYSQAVQRSKASLVEAFGAGRPHRLAAERLKRD